MKKYSICLFVILFIFANLYSQKLDYNSKIYYKYTKTNIYDSLVNLLYEDYYYYPPKINEKSAAEKQKEEISKKFKKEEIDSKTNFFETLGFWGIDLGLLLAEVELRLDENSEIDIPNITLFNCLTIENAVDLFIPGKYFPVIFQKKHFRGDRLAIPYSMSSDPPTQYRFLGCDSFKENDAMVLNRMHFSIKVPKGFIVTLFHEDNYINPYLKIEAKVSSIKLSNLNKKKIKNGVTWYSSQNMTIASIKVEKIVE